MGESRAEEGGNSGSEEVGEGGWVGACGYVLMTRESGTMGSENGRLTREIRCELFLRAEQGTVDKGYNGM